MMMQVSAQPRMNGDEAFRSAKLRRLREPHVWPLNGLVEKWVEEGRQVPWVDPDLGGIHSRILFLLESPGPASSTGHGSGVISPDNDDQTAERFWRISQQAGLARDEYMNWNVVPWYVSGTGKNVNATSTDACAALPYLHEFITLLTQLRVVVTMGGFAESAWLRYLRQPDSPVTALITCPHPSASARRGRPEFEKEIGIAMVKERRHVESLGTHATIR